MNPKHLFALNANCRRQYQIQPDRFDYIREKTIEYERPPYLEKSALRFWYNTQPEGYETHWHDAQEIIVPLEESYCVTIQDVSYPLEPGDILLIPPGCLHSIKGSDRGSRFIFLLEMDFFCRLESFAQIRALLSHPVLINADTCPEIYERSISLIMEIAAHYWSDNPVKQMYIYARMMELYACYAEHYWKNAHSPSVQDDAPQSEKLLQKLNSLLGYLERHYAEDISLDQAARMVGLSKYYFTKIFKRHTSQTYYDYLSFLRIQAAEDLLGNNSLPIADIAAACGYASISSFNRVFRKLKGSAPSEYRKYMH